MGRIIGLTFPENEAAVTPPVPEKKTSEAGKDADAFAPAQMEPKKKGSKRGK